MAVNNIQAYKAVGAIVGSIAEAIWGIPEELKRGVMPYLTDEMKEVVEDFYERIS